MPQPRKTDRPQIIHTTLPASLLARIYASLYSPLEGRVPRGALQTFLVRAAEDLLVKLETQNDG
jgi:hypothetical protein